MSVTPMSRVKTIMKDILDTIGGNIYKDFSLQESSPKWDPYGREDGQSRWMGSYTKGVKSEFIRILATCSKNSFGFTYNNIKSDISDVIVGVSIKRDEKITYKNYPFAEFKELLKEFNKRVKLLDKSQSLSNENLYICLEEVFDIYEIDDDIELVEKISKEVKKEHKILNVKLEEANKDVKSIKKKLASKRGTITKKVNEFSDSIDYDKLKEEFEKASKAFNNAERLRANKQNELFSTHKIEETNRELNNASNTLKKLEEEFDLSVDKHTKAYGINIKTKVLKEIEN